jgi:TonB family protein
VIALVIAAALGLAAAADNAPTRADTAGVAVPAATGKAPVTADTAAAPTVRMPGTWMRLGEAESRILARANFPAADGPKGNGIVTRQGPALWFGISGQVALRFRDDRLDQAEFTIENTAPYWIDYVRDQLRLAGYRASCEQDDPGLVQCDWRGETSVRFELREHRLLVRITPAEPIAAPPPRRPAGRDTVPVFPQVFVLGRGAPAGVHPPALADSTPLVSPAYPAAAREAGVQGRIWVRALVDTNGAILNAQVVRSIPELDSAAVAVARRCRFRPYVAQGSPVRFRVEIPVLFTEH